MPRALVLYLALLVGIGVASALTTRLGSARAAVAARIRALHPGHEAVPAHRPIEQVCADLRRLRPEVQAPRVGVTMARQRGIVWAYDDNLVLACAALGISTTIRSLPDGLDREAERIRVESALREAGLRW